MEIFREFFLEQSTSLLNRGSTPFSFGVLVIFYYAFEEARLLFFWSPLFEIWGFTNLLARLSLGHNFDTMLDEHDSP